MKIDVTDLKKRPGAQIEVSFTEELPSFGEETDQDVTLLSPVEAQLRLKNVEKAILVEGKIRAQVRLCCSRCLEEFSQNFEVTISEAYNDAESLPQRGKEQEDEINIFAGNTIDLTAAVRENLLAALPMKAICRPDCRGLCSRCGHNLNLGPCGCREQEIDPRLATLGRLLKGKED